MEPTFIIQFGPVHNQRCTVHAQVGDRQAQGWFQLPWCDDAYDGLAAAFEINAALPVAQGDPQSPHSVGGRLFKALFADQSVHDLFYRHLGDGHRSFRLLLSFDHEADGFRTLYRYPWEMLCDHRDEQGFLAVQRIAVVRRVHTKIELRRQARTATQQLRILLAVSNSVADQVIAGEDEALRLGRALEKQGAFVQVLPAATPDGLRAALQERDYDIVHLAAHGACGELLFEDGAGGTTRVSSEQFSQLLAQAPSLRVVFLNTCFSSANRRETDGFPDGPMLGVAPDLLRKGVPTIIGMQFRINDDDALVLSETFYGQLARGVRLDEAVFAARRALYSKQVHHSAWAAVVVLSRQENHVVFAARQSGVGGHTGQHALPALGRWLPLKELASRHHPEWRLTMRLCLGRDLKTEREVVLRLIEPGPDWTNQAVEDLETAVVLRAKQLDSVRHGNLVRVQDWGRDGNVLYLVYESFTAKPLQHWLGAGQELSQFFVVDVMEQLGAALDTLHRHRLVHGHVDDAVWVQTGQDQRCSVRLLGLFDDVIQRQIKPEPLGQPFEARRFGDMVAFGKICHRLLTGKEAVVEDGGPEKKVMPVPSDFGLYKKIFDQVFHAETGERALAGHVAAELAQVVDQRSLPRGYCYVLGAVTLPAGGGLKVPQTARHIETVPDASVALVPARHLGTARRPPAPKPLLAAVAAVLLCCLGGGGYALRGLIFTPPVPIEEPSQPTLPPPEPYFRYPDLPADFPSTPGYLVFASWYREGEQPRLDAGLKDRIQTMLAERGVAIHESMWMDAFLDQPQAFEKLVKQPYELRGAELKTPAKLVLVETKYRSLKREYFREYSAETTVTLVEAASGRRLKKKTVAIEPEKTGFEDQFSDLLKQKIAPAVVKTIAKELH